MKYLIVTLVLILASCSNKIEIDFHNNTVIACENKYDKKDDIIYYENKRTEFLSQSTGVLQFVIIDVYQDRKVINEFEIENYVCYEITEQSQFDKIVSD